MSKSEAVWNYIWSHLIIYGSVMFYVNIDGVDYPSNNLPPSSSNKATIERRERRKRNKNMATWISFTGEPVEYTDQPTQTNFTFAPLPTTSPQVTTAVPQSYTNPFKRWSEDCDIKKEGKTPMRYNDNYACATVTAPQSDTAVQRDYLLRRLDKAEYPKSNELRKFFNIGVDNSPKTYKELVDAIKNDKFSIDKKAQKRVEADEAGDEDDHEFYFRGPFYGIIWDGPKEDLDGFRDAQREAEKQARAAKDVIMTGDAAAGLKALQDFEAWLPVGKSN